MSAPQRWALVSSSELPKNTFMIVNYPSMDYKLLVTDESHETKHSCHVVQAMKLGSRIVEGGSLPKPLTNDCLFRFETNNSNKHVIRCLKEPRFVLTVATGKRENELHLLAGVCTGVAGREQLWKLENRLHLQ